jgi:hypothetical protein
VRVCRVAGADGAREAGLDEGLLSLSLPVIVYMESPYMEKNYSDE